MNTDTLYYMCHHIKLLKSIFKKIEISFYGKNKILLMRLFYRSITIFYQTYNINWKKKSTNLEKIKKIYIYYQHVVNCMLVVVHYPIERNYIACIMWPFNIPIKLVCSYLYFGR